MPRTSRANATSPAKPTRHDRGRYQVATEGRDAVLRRRALLAQQSHQLGQAALTAFGRNLVDVVDMQEGDLGRLGHRGQWQHEHQADRGRPSRDSPHDAKHGSSPYGSYRQFSGLRAQPPRLRRRSPFGPIAPADSTHANIKSPPGEPPCCLQSSFRARCGYDARGNKWAVPATSAGGA